MKQKFKTGWEYDAHGKSRKYHSWNSGVLRYIKNTMYRRIRKGQRLVIAEGLSEYLYDVSTYFGHYDYEEEMREYILGLHNDEGFAEWRDWDNSNQQ